MIDESNTATSLSKGLAILESLANAIAPLGVSEIARRLAVPKSTVHRLLRVLHEFGVVDQRDDGMYQLGIRMLQLASSAGVSADLRRIVRPHLERLRTETRETAHLGVVADGYVMYIEKVESLQSVRMLSSIGQRNPLWCTALGKALLAFGDAATTTAVLQRMGPDCRRTVNTITTATALNAELKRIRERGYAVDNEELELGLRCIAAPITSDDEVTTLAVSVSGPTNRLTEDSVASVASRVMSAARLIGRDMQGLGVSGIPRAS